MESLVCVVKGKKFTVLMTKTVAKRFGQADARYRSRCLKWMKIFAEEGSKKLIETQFKSEGRFSIGDKKGTKTQVFAFKAYQLRVYGGFIPRTGGFACTGIDTAKKKYAADNNKLITSAKILGRIMQTEVEDE